MSLTQQELNVFKEMVHALHCLGTANAATEMGAIEVLSLANKEGFNAVAESLENLGVHIEHAADALAQSIDNLANAVREE